MDWACGMHGGKERGIQGFGERDHLEDLLKLIFKRQNKGCGLH
jgi:hypothetical protein